ncbi:MAG: LysR family transcriptional regulator [Shewanella psychromarinicola]|uniref:LysR family transcriptional regulator n=1 Tax=Shewanella psychromarinicola TaxID=2487742 RepID=A0A3N4DCT2_9GAMM|nr:LysR family transcriptional regulator [Shewanella psychromarinicola]AZG33802.1 LysR family transcriptional regulator [Shewanella psychromarinicola]AZG35898.1 LysR family transcriptional regulator [Shewanella psychromarinicola]MCL1084489.1 LysR family transcriptional regulator [Shewanella psychromarinicola]RPA22407.1 LysR family transcriptional regulator [Shewanella psychromarinicola]RPA22490.1 LysR family transcriptional regulator [Shewanella psychromarinicola]
MDTNKIIPLLPDMAIFVTVVEQGNFSKAARKLGVTPSAVSRQISRLEDALGIKLLQRTTRQLALTESGKITFDYCKQMVESAEQAVNASTSTTSTVSGLLRVAAPKSLASRVLRPLFIEFLKCYPDIQLHLKVTDRVLDPIHDGVDFLIHINDNPIEALVNVKIGRVEQVLCASPDFLANHDLPTHPDDLKYLSCLCLGENTADNRWRFSNENQQATVHVTGAYLINHSEMRCDAIEQGFGVGGLPDYIAQQGIEAGTLIPLLEDWQLQGNYHGDICLQYVQSKYMPNKNRVFIDFMKQNLLVIKSD